MRNFSVLLIVCVLNSCSVPEQNSYFEVNIDSGWEFRKLSDSIWYKARIPGNILSDLLKNRLIDDPRIHDNINTISWIEDENWEYRSIFDVSDDLLLQDSIYLNFAGVFPNSYVFLNNVLLKHSTGFVHNAFIVSKKLLKPANNKICIQFHSPYKRDSLSRTRQEDDISLQTGFIPAALINGTRVNPKIYNFGVLQPVKLIAWSDTRINNICISTDSINNNTAYISASVDIESTNTSDCELIVDINFGFSVVSNPIKLNKGMQSKKIELQITNPDLWWSNGLGRQPLYHANIGIKKKRTFITRKAVTFGIRKIELIDRDSTNNSFYFKLNNKPLFIKGASFIPASIFQFGDTGFYKEIINNAVLANINMLRIWGGAIYEKPEFYDLCSKKGILLWHDFDINLSSNAGNMHDIVESNINELVPQIKQIQNNPGIALCYGILNYTAKDKINWKKNKIDPVFLIDTLEKTLQFRWPGIPFCFNKTKFSNSPVYKINVGSELSNWYNASPLESYSKSNYQFVYEFGVQSLPDFKTINSFIDEDDDNIWSPILATHQFDKPPVGSSGLSGTQLLYNYIQMYYNEPDNFESFVYLSQIFQANVLKYAIESCRIKQPYCMGSIFWHFNDSWPSVSWSVIDNYMRQKPAYYAVKEAYKNIIIVPQLWKNQVKIWTVSDSASGLFCTSKTYLMDFDGKIYSAFTDTVNLVPNHPVLIFSKSKKILAPENLSNKLLLYVTLLQNNKLIAENILYFSDPRFLDLPVPDIQLKILDSGNNKFQIDVSSDKLVKNLVLYTLHNESIFYTNNIDILPGETKKIMVEYKGTLSELEVELHMKSLVESY